MTQNNDRQSIVLDLRCMQDPNYAGRGIGRHTMTLLRRAPKAWHIAGLIDPAMNPLPPEAREALGAVHLNAYAASRAGTPRRGAGCFQHRPACQAKMARRSSNFLSCSSGITPCLGQWSCRPRTAIPCARRGGWALALP